MQAEGREQETNAGEVTDPCPSAAKQVLLNRHHSVVRVLTGLAGVIRGAWERNPPAAVCAVLGMAEPRCQPAAESCCTTHIKIKTWNVSVKYLSVTDNVFSKLGAAEADLADKLHHALSDNAFQLFSAPGGDKKHTGVVGL